MMLKKNFVENATMKNLKSLLKEYDKLKAELIRINKVNITKIEAEDKIRSDAIKKRLDEIENDLNRYCED